MTKEEIQAAICDLEELVDDYGTNNQQRLISYLNANVDDIVEALGE